MNPSVQFRGLLGGSAIAVMRDRPRLYDNELRTPELKMETFFCVLKLEFTGSRLHTVGVAHMLVGTEYCDLNPNMARFSCSYPFNPLSAAVQVKNSAQHGASGPSHLRACWHTDILADINSA